MRAKSLLQHLPPATVCSGRYLPGMSEIALTVTTVLGAILTLGGLAYGARKLAREYKGLGRRLEEINRIAHDPAIDGDEQNRQRHALIVPSSSWSDIEYFREYVRYFILQQAARGLGWPIAFTASGVVLSTVASVWSIWV